MVLTFVGYPLCWQNYCYCLMVAPNFQYLDDDGDGGDDDVAADGAVAADAAVVAVTCFVSVQ
jgi:hypothetical protein